MTREQQAAHDALSQVEVDVGDKRAVQRWASALGVTDEALLAAVQVVGRVDRIKEYLGAGGSAGQQQDG